MPPEHSLTGILMTALHDGFEVSFRVEDTLDHKAPKRQDIVIQVRATDRDLVWSVQRRIPIEMAFDTTLYMSLHLAADELKGEMS